MVHFAVDPASAAMTTRLAGTRTRFLPFNRGHNLGAGNPPNPDGHRTAYLWEQVWSRDAWMDILRRFIHVEKPSRGSSARPEVIFPRFHQWDAVRRLEADAKERGAGHSYLVQHSAGSGKSNSIAWLAHRLSSLHTDDSAQVFNKVVVITDRVVLDRQLQDTISQFEHALGVVERIDENSAQLAAALAGEQARIIVTTLQKFPFVFDKIESLPERNYAVIVDEAHSSQTGEAARELRRALGSAQPEIDTDMEAGEVETLLAEAVAARGRQPNLSFFAFTATPKGRTLELFGEVGDGGRHEPFHLYPMRQAIEEGFIEDVLAGYLTYNQYFHLEKAILDDPEYDTGKARTALARFVALHPDNLAQKAEIIVEHYRTKIARQVGGETKAMVVCSSRPHAVRMWEALRGYANNLGYDLGVLVAFSGEVEGLTESKANGFPESQTAERFDTDEWQIMVVAEKFQTGFDQPKLTAMYVDKTLTGLAAVQTLSRLNRIHPDKSGTFVIDFVNDAHQIGEEFAVYHGKTVAPPTDPNLFCRALAMLIRDRDPGESINLGTEVELTHLRHEIGFEGSISLPDGEGEVATIYSGTGPLSDPEEERLSQIIARLNERFGTDWTEEDRLMFEAAAGDLISDVEIQNQAVNNDEDTFRTHVFPAHYEKALLSRIDRNSDLIYAYLDSNELQAEVMDIFAVNVQRRAAVARQRTCPIGDLLGPDRESLFLEYKSTLRWDIREQRKGGIPEDAVIKTIAGFANSEYGGTLLVGVADDGSVHGLEDDYATFSKHGERGDQDLWGQHLQNLILNRLGDAVMPLVAWQFHTINGDHLTRISIDPSGFPVLERKGEEEIFWLRTPTSTVSVNVPEERDRIIASRWGDQ